MEAIKKVAQSMLIIVLGFTIQVSAQEKTKLAQTGMQFLSVVSDARAAALGGSMTSLELQSSSMFFNPAGMAKMEGLVDISFSKNDWIADISHNALSVGFSPLNRKVGVFGLTVQSVDYGEILKTEVAPGTDKGYNDLGSFSPSAFSVGLGYAKDLTDRFSVGGHIKYVRWSLGESQVYVPVDSSVGTVDNELSPLAYDFGTLFRTGIKSLSFGMSVRNFSREIKFAKEGFQLPLVFSFGISFDVMDFLPYENKAHALWLSMDAVHPRSHPEQILVGMDYRFMEMVSLRAGYIPNNDEEDFSFGIGVMRYKFAIDYAYTPFGIFDNVQRFSVRFHL